ncbi:predicted protein [Chaetoceros tenuissimus]|uniref:ETS domain-containing protein n=1 Tax=Chaetoceros tenuissimus TaxID=426638 RepID=A0AAD3CK02_9STRA|nr:predicted protein [Chaetoceros tenuissimus]
MSDNPEYTGYDVGCKLVKHFPGHGWYGGKIKEIRLEAAENKTRRITYSDGDVEDLSIEEIQKARKSYASKLSRDRKKGIMDSGGCHVSPFPSSENAQMLPCNNNNNNAARVIPDTIAQEFRNPEQDMGNFPIVPTDIGDQNPDGVRFTQTYLRLISRQDTPAGEVVPVPNEDAILAHEEQSTRLSRRKRLADTLAMESEEEGDAIQDQRMRHSKRQCICTQSVSAEEEEEEDIPTPTIRRSPRLHNTQSVSVEEEEEDYVSEEEDDSASARETTNAPRPANARQPRGPKGGENSLPNWLFNYLQSEEHSNILNWTVDGQSFVIIDEEGFLRLYNSRKSKAAKDIESVYHNLRRWGFSRRINNKEKMLLNNLQEGMYLTHKNFQRDNQGIVVKMSENDPIGLKFRDEEERSAHYKSYRENQSEIRRRYQNALRDVEFHQSPMVEDKMSASDIQTLGNEIIDTVPELAEKNKGKVVNYVFFTKTEPMHGDSEVHDKHAMATQVLQSGLRRSARLQQNTATTQSDANIDYEGDTSSEYDYDNAGPNENSTDNREALKFVSRTKGYEDCDHIQGPQFLFSDPCDIGGICSANAIFHKRLVLPTFAKAELGARSQILYQCHSRINARNLENYIQFKLSDREFGTEILWRGIDSRNINYQKNDERKTFTVGLTTLDASKVRQKIEDKEIVVNGYKNDMSNQKIYF